MGEGLWRTRFGGDPSLVGRQVRLNGQPFTVIGIVRDDVQLQRPAQIWSLLSLPPNLPRTVQASPVIGRLKPGVTLDAAQADLEVVADRIAQAYPETNKGWSAFVEPLRSGVMSAALQNTSRLLLGVVGFVLLLCCANVANLLLARGNVRARELAVRAALGAGRARIVSQLLTESLVLATVGGALGAAIGAVILRVDTVAHSGRAAPGRGDDHLRQPGRGLLRDRRGGCRCALWPRAGVAGDTDVAPAGDLLGESIQHASRRTVSQRARRRRSRGRRRPAVRRRFAAAHDAGARQFRSRVPRRQRQRPDAGLQPAGAASGYSISRHSIADAVLRPGLA